MSLLIDTHTLIWHYEAKDQLSQTARDAINNGLDPLVISTVTIWELSIKTGIGKLKLDVPVTDIIAWYKAEGATILPITEAHALGVATLPYIHRDPFDRLLVSQAICEGMTIVTVDEFIRQYPIKYLW